MVVEVVAKNEVDENGLGELIMVETGSSEERKKSGADVLKTSNAFVGKTEVEIGLGSENIQRSKEKGEAIRKRKEEKSWKRKEDQKKYI